MTDKAKTPDAQLTTGACIIEAVLITNYKCHVWHVRLTKNSEYLLACLVQWWPWVSDRVHISLLHICRKPRWVTGLGQTTTKSLNRSPKWNTCRLFREILNVSACWHGVGGNPGQDSSWHNMNDFHSSRRRNSSPVAESWRFCHSRDSSQDWSVCGWVELYSLIKWKEHSFHDLYTLAFYIAVNLNGFTCVQIT